MRLFVPQNYSPISKVNDPENMFWLDENYRYLSSFTNFRKVSVDYEATVYDYIVEMDTTSGDRTVTLPDPTTVIGKQMIVVKIYPANTVTVNVQDSGEIDGASTFDIDHVDLGDGTSYYAVVTKFLAAGTLGWISLGTIYGRY